MSTNMNGWEFPPGRDHDTKHHKETDERPHHSRDTEGSSIRDDWNLPEDDSSVEYALESLTVEKFKEEALNLFIDVEGGHFTTHEISNKLEYQIDITAAGLSELHDENLIEHRSVNSADLWWLSYNNISTDIDGDLSGELIHILINHRRPGESIEETYERVKGNPSPEILREILNENSESSDTMRRAIQNRNNNSSNSKEALRDRFE